MVIDRKLNLVLTDIQTEEDGNLQVFIPQPTKIAIDSISKILGGIYTLATKGVPYDILIVDYKQHIDEILENNPRREELKNMSAAFIDRTLSGAFVFFEKSQEFKSYNDVNLNDETINTIEGFLLFLLAFLRYLAPEKKKIFKEEYSTSQDFTAWKTSLMQSFVESKEDSKVQKSPEMGLM